MAKLNFQQSSVSWCFWNHFNILIWCSRYISYCILMLKKW